MISELANSGGMPALEAVIRFTSQRQKVLAHNIANMTTPDFRPADLSVAGFQAQLRDAIEARRNRAEAGEAGELRLSDSEEIKQLDSGEFVVNPTTGSNGLLKHDRNNTDPERLMQSVVENQATFRIAAELIRNRNEMLRAAIAQRA